MQFSATTFFALAAAMGASADVVFSVSDFTAACIPHSALCSYEFTVYQPGAGETNATGVACSTLQNSDRSLPAVTDAACTDSSRTFSVAKPAEGGLVLSVSQPITPSSNTTGSYTIPASDLETTQTGASTQQSYTGPTEFDLSG